MTASAAKPQGASMKPGLISAWLRTGPSCSSLRMPRECGRGQGNGGGQRGGGGHCQAWVA